MKGTAAKDDSDGSKYIMSLQEHVLGSRSCIISPLAQRDCPMEIMSRLNTGDSDSVCLSML